MFFERKYILFLINTLILTVLLYQFADKTISTYFYTLDNKIFKEVFAILTEFGNSAWYFIVSILLFVYFKIIKKQFKAASMALYIFMTNLIAGLLVWVFKIPFGRARPKLYFQENLYGFEWFEIKPDLVSFPSGHSITVISTAVALSLIFPKWKYLFLPLAALVAFSRVVLTQHYMSDVVFASFLGSMVAIFLHQYYFKSKEF
ncbi:phosphatase PAP2 family protein [bacterium]|nr:phosphatase PAP2 family protein [bacterium]MBU1959329.1 phosphatase PAP2 family protein [bacterium]